VRRIDAHTHYLPQALIHVLERRAGPPRLISGDGARLVDCGEGLVYPLFDELTDTALHLERMDRLGIDTAVLSAIPPGVDGLGGEAATVARACNDELAALIEDSEGRFAALATLPACAPEAAAEELGRVASLGLSGAQLLSNVEGEPLDHPRFEPIFDQAEVSGLPLVLHPNRPMARAGVEEFGLLTTLGFLFDTTTCAVRLVLAGTYERHPDLKLLLPHVGSMIPYQLARIDHELSLMEPDDVHLSASPSEHLRRLYLDSVCLWAPALALALAVFGEDRVLFGSDEPFWRADQGITTVDQLSLASEAAEKVFSRNAELLFGLGERSEVGARAHG
jgi:5-carboxyvanillate decarboxylase